jgi:hypothetical protein
MPRLHRVVVDGPECFDGRIDRAEIVGLIRLFVWCGAFGGHRRAKLAAIAPQFQNFCHNL